MKKLLAFAVSLLLAGTFSSSSHAQGGYGAPCNTPECATCCINPYGYQFTPPPQPTEYLEVECAASDCNDPCGGGCKQLRIRNMYDCKNIVKIELNAPAITFGNSYGFCSAFIETGNPSDPCEADTDWQGPDPVLPGTYDVTQHWLGGGCWMTPTGHPGEHWWITPRIDPNDPCPNGVAFGSWIYIDFCGSDLHCEKMTWTVYFSDGSTCPIDMSQVPSCCP